ncbi:MAG: zf-HC2 domain-containing protein [Gammaproteobacteria bacterium]
MSPAPVPPGCEAVSEMLAWHANGTLGATDRDFVESHIGACDACRHLLALERRIVESIRAPRDNVEQSPAAGWQKLAARLDAELDDTREMPADRRAAASVPRAPATVSPLVHAVARAPKRFNWSVALGAAVALQAAAIAVLAVALVQNRQVEEAPRFHTLSNADPTLAADGPLLRVAFDSAIDEAAARGVARTVSGHILAGPSPDNVYTFVFQPSADSRLNMDDTVSWLRRQAHVLLVEPVIIGPPSAGTP